MSSGAARFLAEADQKLTNGVPLRSPLDARDGKPRLSGAF